MTSLRSHIADVLHQWWNKDYEISEAVADALLADPTLAAIIDLAATNPVDAECSSPVKGADQWLDCGGCGPCRTTALLAAWRASRAEQEPER